MRRILVVIMVVVSGLIGVLVASNLSGVENNDNTAVPEKNKSTASSKKISAEEAKSIMDGKEPYILLDVRTESEFKEEHLEGAMLIPSDEIVERAETDLPDKDALIMVYCRSGGRSSRATKELADMGYTNVRDIGGIIDWPYDITRTQLD
jgi:rhodanese-related sulfurtransferase